ncbi:hypothetical protein CLV62_10921 [Dysgonomonas alginatilytica]|uniref:Cell-wall binding lipoprotein n=1 Tax=Dysgonomonas alginatilytica TaxID=1605892 RepID=A0A2V3PP91_9BACT|nr:hypothetical protein [Dysgonomonas alginatilytica]PXV64695.1 hypothetical protein CLV62_10921 [Dysgonomonas alginatilytica]
MKKLLFLLLPLSLILTSCEKKVDPLAYNEQLVAYSTEADNYLVTLDSKIDVFFDSEEFTADDIAQLNEGIKEAKDSIQSDLDKIKVLPKAEGADDFYNTTIAYVESLLTQIDVYKEQYSKLSNDISEEELVKMDDIINNSLANTDAKFEDMQKAQSEYAKANNIDLNTHEPATLNIVE